jgi:hypothetical protein
MLKIVFDILEGDISSIIHILYTHSFAMSRYLRFEHLVLHCNISKGNILHIEDDLRFLTTDETVGPEGLFLSFVEYLLGERCVGILHDWAYTDVTPNQWWLAAVQPENEEEEMTGAHFWAGLA